MWQWTVHSDGHSAFYILHGVLNKSYLHTWRTAGFSSEVKSQHHIMWGKLNLFDLETGQWRADIHNTLRSEVDQFGLILPKTQHQGWIVLGNSTGHAWCIPHGKCCCWICFSTYWRQVFDFATESVFQLTDFKSLVSYRLSYCWSMLWLYEEHLTKTFSWSVYTVTSNFSKGLLATRCPNNDSSKHDWNSYGVICNACCLRCIRKAHCMDISTLK